MAPGRKRGGAKGKAKNSSLNLGDLVLAKVKGFPAWPAQISDPEDHNKLPDPRKHFVLFFGTKEIAFVAPADIQPFTSQVKDKLLHKCKGKTVKQFSQAVKEICDIFDGNDGQTSQPDANSTEIVDEEMTTDAPSGETSSNDNVNQGPGLERFSHAKREMGYQEEHPNISRIVNDRSPPVTEEQVELSNDDVTFTSDTGDKTAFQTSHTEHTVTGNSDVIRRSSSHGSKNETNVGVVSPDSGGIIKKAKKALKDTTHGGGSDDLLKAAKGRERNSVEPSGKKLRSELELGKDNLLNNEVPHPTKRPKSLGDAPKKSQAYRKNDLSKKAGNEDEKRSTPILKTKNRLSSKAQTNGLDSGVPRKQANDEDKQSTPNMKPKTQLPSKAQTDGLYSRAHGDEDVLPPAKRRRRETDDRTAESSIPAKKADTVKSATQAPMKRRAVRICDDDEDEPKTPVHGRSTSKGVYGVSHTSMSVQQTVVVTETVQDPPGTRNRSLPVKGVVANSQQLVQSEKKLSQEAMKALVSPSKSLADSEKKSSQEVMKALVSPSKSVVESEKRSSQEVMKALVSPSKSPFDAHHQMVEPLKGNKALGMVSGNVSQKKGQSGSLKTSTGIHDSGHRSQNNAVNERSRPVISGDKPRSTPKSTAISTPKYNSKSTPKSASKSVIDTAAVLRNPSDSSLLSSERSEMLGVDRTTVLADSRSAEATNSMRHLIAVAQAKRQQAQSQNHVHDSLTVSHMTATEAMGKSPGSISAAQPVGSGIKVQTDGQFESNDQSDPADVERRTSSGHRPAGGSLSGGTEAAVARDTFEGMIETLSRTKDSIGRATRHAIDCAKQGIANEVVELLTQKLENESNLRRKVDLLFLVDSITQISHSQKGIAGASYIPIVQTALPRLLGAAAPPGANAHENRKQCLKVLNLWLERKILPDTLLRGYIKDMGTSNDDASAKISSAKVSSAKISSRRPSRSERAVDDPLREMDGMFVDEYGSNATFQLPGLLSSHVFEDEEEDDIFNFSLKEHTGKPTLELNPSAGEIETCSVTSNDRRHHILEDVDGELEMEDVSGHSKDEKIFPSGSSYNTLQEDQESDRTMDTSSDNSNEASPLRPSSPPLPPGSPPRTPPLPSSPPPPPLSPIVPPPPSTPSPPPPPPPPPPMPLPPSQTYPPHQPTAGSPQVLFLQPSTPQNVHPYQSQMPSNVPLNARLGAHVDPAVRGEMFPQQPSGFNSSRTVDYGHETYTNPQGSLSNQQFQTANVSLPPRAFQPTMLPQTAAGQFQYPNPGMRPSYPSMYGLTNPDGPRRYVADEQWRPPSNEFGSDSQRGAWIGSGRSSLTSGPPFAHEGYFRPPMERPPTNFQPAGQTIVPAKALIPGHSGSLMVPCRPDLSSLNTWRPS